ncbi:hypothetical protein ACIHFE_05355 [Streptomyces sp. NPDC052396]|uniref:hypothetical protein n=1 Tax=Streptomyces sp. NPDC052396 TaxID=3365689 RepID=UPI0037D3072B
MPGDPFAGAPAQGGGAPWPGEAPGAGTGSYGGGVPWPGEAAHPPVPGDPFAGAPGAPAAPVQGGGAPWPAGSAGTGGVPVPGDPFAGAPGQGGGAAWSVAPETTQQFAAPETTQQFPAPGLPGQGPKLPFPVPGERTDTPPQGMPAVPPPPPAATGPQGGKKQGNKKKGGQQQGGQRQGGQQQGGGAKVPPPARVNAAAETMAAGMPAVPAPGGAGAPRVPGVPGAGKPADSGAPRVPVPKPKPGPAVPKPPAADGAPAKAPAAKSAPKSAPKKKGRSKLVLLGGGLVALVGVAYGAGLLMDHADVPQGTTVLGVDIGGSSKDQAVQKLDARLGDRATAPLKVSIGGKQAQLKPSVAGLSIDTQETVRSVSGRDYNPVTVIGSLVGGSRKAEPTVITDEEKITAALQALSGEAGGAKDGTIKFVPGKAVPVYGKPYQGLDMDKAVKAVSDAYRQRADTGQDTVVELPSSGQQPKVSKAEVDREMKEFAEPAMSGLVTIETSDHLHSIQFGPDRSLPKILSVKEVGGKLVESYNLEALKELYGQKFAGVMVQRAEGKTPVMPQDVAGALGKALRGKTPAERVGVIQLNAS